MLDVMERDDRVVLLLGDIGVHGFREAFERFPTRTFNIGILEQASVGLAAGLAIEGLVPVFHSIAPFIVERAFEQIKIDFGYQQLGGNFVSVGASYDYAALGATHHCPGDVQILKTIPGVQIFVPGHPLEFDNHFKTNYANGKLNYYRLSEQSNLYPLPQERLRHGNQGVVIAFGPTLDRVLEATDDLDVTVHYRNTIAPFEMPVVHRRTRLITVEPFYEGTMAAEIEGYSKGSEILRIGVPRRFLTNYGSRQEHDEKYGLTASAIREKIKGFLNL